MRSKCFDVELDERLISLVRGYPVLYEISTKNFKNVQMKECAWKEISTELDKSVSECKIRWRTIRDSYKKNKNKLKAVNETGSAASSCKSKYNSENLKFLDTSFEERTTLSSFENSEETNDSTDISESEVDSNSELENDGNLPRKKLKICTGRLVLEEINKGRKERKKILLELEQKKKQEHPVEKFFHNMAEVVIGLPPHLIAEARMKICEVVSQLEIKALKEKQDEDKKYEI